MALTEEEKKEHRRESSRKWYYANKDKARESSRKWCTENREKHLERRRNYRKDNLERERKRCRGWIANNPEKAKEGRLKQTLNTLKSRSKKIGVKFDLTEEWYAAQLARGKCAVTNIPFSDRANGKSPNNPSFDRIIAGGDYTQENVQLTTYHYNVARSEFSHEQLMEMVYALHPAETWQFKVNKFRAKRFNVRNDSISRARVGLRNLLYKSRQEAAIDKQLASRAGSPQQS